MKPIPSPPYTDVVSVDWLVGRIVGAAAGTRFYVSSAIAERLRARRFTVAPVGDRPIPCALTLAELLESPGMPNDIVLQTVVRLEDVAPANTRTFSLVGLRSDMVRALEVPFVNSRDEEPRQ